MLVTTAATGLLCGFACSMPVAGPVALLVLHRGLQARFESARRVLVGAAAVEGAYVYLAFWGFSDAIADQPWIVSSSRVAGAVVLILLGTQFWRMARLDLTSCSAPFRPRSRNDFVMGFSLMALNPTLIIMWAAIVTTLEQLGFVLVEPGAGLVFALASACGMLLWFAFVLRVIDRVRDALSSTRVTVGVRAVAVCMITTGTGLLGVAVWSG